MIGRWTDRWKKHLYMFCFILEAISTNYTTNFWLLYNLPQGPSVLLVGGKPQSKCHNQADVPV